MSTTGERPQSGAGQERSLSPDGGAGYVSKFMGAPDVSDANPRFDPRLKGVAAPYPERHLPTTVPTSADTQPRRGKKGRVGVALGLVVATAAAGAFGVAQLDWDKGLGQNPDLQLPDDEDLQGPGEVTIDGPDFEAPAEISDRFNGVLDNLNSHPNLKAAFEAALGVDSLGDQVLKVSVPSYGGAIFFTMGSDDPRTLATQVLPLEGAEAAQYTQLYPDEYGLEMTTDDRVPDTKVIYTGEDPDHPDVIAGEFVVIDEPNNMVIVVNLLPGSQNEFPNRFAASSVEREPILTGNLAAEIRNTLLS